MNGFVIILVIVGICLQSVFYLRYAPFEAFASPIKEAIQSVWFIQKALQDYHKTGYFVDIS